MDEANRRKGKGKMGKRQGLIMKAGFLMFLIGGGTMDNPTIIGFVLIFVGLTMIYVSTRKGDKGYDMGRK